MKQFVHCTIVLLFFLCLGAATTQLHAQLGVFNPNDTVKTYDPAKPPVKPASGKVGKWVRTPRVSWSTSSFKCYFYNNMAFRLKFPKNFDSTKKYPILIFFHGRGEYGTIYDNEFQLYLGGESHRNAVDGGRFEGFLLYPQHTSEFWSSGNVTNVYNLLEKIMIPQNIVDPFRVYVNGLSAGAGTAWSFLAKYTKLVTAITPISSATTSQFDSAQKYKFTPIYHFQGGLDTDPPPSAARSLGNKILGIGGNYKYKEFATRGHDCWYQAWSEDDYYPFYAQAHKANPWPLFGRTEFCQNDNIGITLGVTPGFDGYEWRKDGVLIPGATSNQIQVSQLGTYDCRIRRGTEWSVWSLLPVTVRIKPPTVQPTITISGLASHALPALDGSTSVPLEVPAGYATYKWEKQGSTTVLSTTRTLTAPAIGNYKVQVTEKWGCGIDSSVVTTPSTTTRIEGESYAAMSGVQKETCGDVGGGQNVGYIDLNNWMDYNISAPSSGTYKLKFRIASNVTGAQFQIRNSAGTVLGTVAVPNTTGWQKYVDVPATISLTAGSQKLRLYSSATPRWNLNWFEFTNPPVTGGKGDGYSAPFPVVNANGSNGPDAVTNLTAAALSKTSVQLQWAQSASPAFNETAFEVYEAAAAGGPYTLKVKTAADATGTTLNGLTSGTELFYQVRAVNNNAASAVAGPVPVTTLSDKNAPTTPANLRLGAITKHSVELLWNAATDDVGVAFYDVYINGTKWYVIPNSLTKALMYNLLPNTTYSFYIVARDAAGNISASSNTVSAKTLTGTIKLDPSMANNSPGNYSVYINMNTDNPAAAPWNNTSVLPSEGTVWSNFKNYAGNVSGVNMTIVDNFSGYNPSGMNTGNNSGVYPDNVMRSSYYCDKGQVAKIQIYDLSLNHTYSFVFFGSRNGTGDRTSVYKIGNKSVSLNASMNSTNTVQIDNVVPDQNGYVSIEIALGPTSIFAYLNSLVIKAYNRNEPSSQPPVVNAGADKTITLPTNSTTLSGSGTDADGTVTAYAWSQLSGPSTATLTNATTATATTSNLVEGVYTFALTATDNDGNNGVDNVSVTVNTNTPTTTKLIKVNVYGGTNPYNNAEWTNWNVGTGAQSNKSVASLKYSDGTASTVGALLSYSGAIVDNTSTYGSGMAPAAVLRYTSTSTPARTLTLSGLSAAKTYNLELYASRNNTGYSSVFTINATSVTIVTDKNLTNKASFTGLTPNASGQIVVNIASGSSTSTTPVNYLNGFMLTEADPGTTLTNTSAVNTSANVVTEAHTFTAARAFPNPVQNHVSLNVPLSKGVPVLSVSLTDVAGSVVSTQNFRNLPQGTWQQRIPLHGKASQPGVYFIHIAGLPEGKTQVLKIVKVK